MTHVRTQLRAALGTALAGLPSAPAVYMSRGRPLDHSQAPCLRITTPQESIEPLGVSDTIHVRSVSVVIKGFVKGADLDNAADQVALEVEQALEAAGDLAGLIKGALQLADTRVELDETTSPPLAVVRMAYTADIYTLASAPDTAI